MAKPGRKKAKFVITDVMIRVATAVAQGDRSLSDILTENKIAERTFYRWKNHPEYQLKLNEILADIDITRKGERIKIAKTEIRRILKHLERGEDKPASRDLIAALKYVGEELGDYEPKFRHDIGVTIVDDIPKKIIETVIENKESDEKEQEKE